jgi:hypothetical protein
MNCRILFQAGVKHVYASSDAVRTHPRLHPLAPLHYPALRSLALLMPPFAVPYRCETIARQSRKRASESARKDGIRLRAPSPGARRTRSARRSRRVGRCDLCACPAVEWPRLSSPGGSSAASAAVSAAPPSVVTGGAAQPKPGAVSCPQRASMRSHLIVWAHGMWRMPESTSRGQQVIFARTLGPRERQDAEWRSQGQCTTVRGRSASLHGL